MLIDTKSLSDFSSPNYDVCIIGSGPAGLSVAGELCRLLPNIKICVLESGLVAPSSFADALREVDSKGIRIKLYSRERVVGGASSTWAGLSSPYDQIDFEERKWMRRSGWPISREELLPYYGRAAKSFRFPSVEWFTDGHWDEVKKAGDLEPRWQALEEKLFVASAEPQHFGKEYRGCLEPAGRDLFIDATVVGLEGESEKSHVKSVLVRTSQGRELRIRARFFVLATGGIENARLLLVSRFACPEGLGNENDQVGRCLMNHPKDHYGIIKLQRPLKKLPAFFGFLHQGFAGYLGLRLPEEVQRREKLLNSYIRFEPIYIWSDNPGVESLVFYTKKMNVIMRGFRRMKKGKIIALRDYSETGDDSDLQNGRKTMADHMRMVGYIGLHLPAVAKYLFHRLQDRRDPRIRAIRVRNFMEMEPNPENRVELSDRKDALGILIPSVRHRASELDKRSISYVHQCLAQDVSRIGLGRLEPTLSPNLEPWPINLDASHHMGTTRMGDDPASSVVDRHCRVHSSDNLFIAGASVFPTSGNANPTYTIVALAVRLADHLVERLK